MGTRYAEISNAEKPGNSAQRRSRPLLPPLSATKVATLLMAGRHARHPGLRLFHLRRGVVYSLSQNLYVAAVVFVWLTTLFLMNFGDLYRYEAATHPLHNILTIIFVLVDLLSLSPRRRILDQNLGHLLTDSGWATSWH